MGANQDKIAELTGISPKVQDEIWAEVMANKNKLEGCAGPHDFSICLDRHTKQPIDNPTNIQLFGAYWRCSKCGGQVDAINKSWYNKGLKAGMTEAARFEEEWANQERDRIAQSEREAMNISKHGYRLKDKN